MNMTKTRISTVGMSREDWLELRKHSIGGSDAAVIVGLNDYASPFTVWADKTGRLPEKPDTEAMRQGRDFESYVVERWSEETGKKARRMNAILYNDIYPFASANVDRVVIGEKAGLECKTTSVMNLKKFKNGEYPPHYYVQCMHYLTVTGYDRWYLAVLVLNQGFYHFIIERDEDEIAALMQQEAEFWQYVEEDSPPPVDGAAATTETLQMIYDKSEDNVISLFDYETAIKEYMSKKDQIKELEQENEEIKQRLMCEMKDNEIAECGPYTVKWKRRTRNTFDYKRFSKENPNYDLSPYFKTTSYRNFNIKEMD